MDVSHVIDPNTVPLTEIQQHHQVIKENLWDLLIIGQTKKSVYFLLHMPNTSQKLAS